MHLGSVWSTEPWARIGRLAVRPGAGAGARQRRLGPAAGTLARDGGRSAVQPGQDVLPSTRRCGAWPHDRAGAPDFAAVSDLPAGDAHASAAALVDEIRRGGAERRWPSGMGSDSSRGSPLGIARGTQAPPAVTCPTGQPFRVRLSQPGDLDSISFPATACRPPRQARSRSGHRRPEFRDVLFALDCCRPVATSCSGTNAPAASWPSGTASPRGRSVTRWWRWRS